MPNTNWTNADGLTLSPERKTMMMAYYWRMMCLDERMWGANKEH